MRLVTTNFDRLFEACDRSLTFNGPASLPDPRRSRQLSGIVHLHGYATRSYDGAHDDEFVLSTADFGRAYLSDGWATTFIRALLEKYQLVFVGYAADDPPVHYLLEALNAGQGPQGNLFAFQEGGEAQARALWNHKGVQAIPYDGANGHAALWLSLESWAERARDPSRWRESVLDRAMDGPASMSAVERGQVRHVVSTASGARAFAAHRPPAEWLSVFDAHVRYAAPIRSAEEEDIFDPFDVFSLDGDKSPEPLDPEDMFAERTRPPSSWDGLELAERERHRVEFDQLSRLRGPGATRQPRLVPRLSVLAGWIAEVAEQPDAIWWAAGQGGFHPELQRSIEYRMERRPLEPNAERAWRLIFQSWRDAKRNGDLIALDLQSRVRRAGWSAEAIRSAARLQRARIEVRQPWRRPAKFSQPDIRLDELLSVTLDFTRVQDLGDIPDAMVPLWVAELGRNLEITVELHDDVYGTHGLMLPSLFEDTDEDPDDRVFGIARPFVRYAEHLKTLGCVSPDAWRREVKGWTSSSALFDRLRVWAASEVSLMSPKDAASTLLLLPARSFWSLEGQRDLLLTLVLRWASIPLTFRRKIERRLLAGPPMWPGGEHTRKYRQRRASATMSRLKWLADQGVAFSFSVPDTIAALQLKAPEWREGWATSAAHSLSSKGGWIATDTSTRGLEDAPARQLLDRAEGEEGHDWGSLTERRPLEGLSVSRPAKVLRSLVLEGREGRYRQRAWQTFLWSTQRKDDRRRLVVQIGRRLAGLPPWAAANLADEIGHWMLETAPRLAQASPETFDTLWHRIVGALREYPNATSTPSPRTRGIDWGSHSLNSPVGRLTQAIFKVDYATEGDKPKPELLTRLEDALSLPGAARCDALVIAASHVAWLHYQASDWTETNILAALGSGDHEDARAFWSGFFWANRMPNAKLFQRLKEPLLSLVIDWDEEITGSRNLPAFVLAGWRTAHLPDVPTVITDDEMRVALVGGGDSFRTGVIYQLEHWFSEEGWGDASLRLFREVWPKQLAARSAAVSDRLVDFALDAGDRFAEIVDVIVPFITPLPPDSWTLYKVKDYGSDAEAPARDPEALIKLLFAALGPKAGEWPYRADRAVEALAADPSLASNILLNELRIRLAAG